MTTLFSGGIYTFAAGEIDAPPAGLANRMLVVVHAGTSLFPTRLEIEGVPMTTLSTNFLNGGINMTVSFLLEADVGGVPTSPLPIIRARSVATNAVVGGDGSWWWVYDAPQTAPEGLTLARANLATGASTTLTYPPTAPEGLGVSSENALLLTSVGSTGNPSENSTDWTPNLNLLEGPVGTGINGGSTWESRQPVANGSTVWLPATQSFLATSIVQVSLESGPPPPTPITDRTVRRRGWRLYGF